MEKQKKRRSGKLSVFLNILLAVALAVALVLLWRVDWERRNADVVAMAKLESEQQRLEKELEGRMQEEIDRVIETTISIPKFEQTALKYNISTEFIQQFFDHALVYKGEDGIGYAPINDELKKHSLDFSLLSREEGRAVYQDETLPTRLGIDVSKYQGEIDWKKVKADGVDFTFVRLGYRGYAGEGKLMVDETYKQNVSGALNAGLDTGIYFFSQALTPEEAVEEAEFVLNNIKGYDLTLPIVFDIEEGGHETARTNNMTNEQITDVIVAFCERIEEAGLKPMVYASARWYFTKMDIAKLEKYDKWLAQYYRTPFFPYQFGIWQYTNTGKVDGIAGNVDLNIAFGEEYGVKRLT